ncbi:MAG: squalene--hopene cyclase [Rhodospirillaceae bacterium]
MEGSASRFRAGDEAGAGSDTVAASELDSRIDAEIAEAARGLCNRQQEDGHWLFELEADATIPAEYVLLNHFLGTPERQLERKIASYLRRVQSARHDGWPLFHDGAFDLSASVKAYYALKLAGDDPDAPHMVRAREAILGSGGAARCNVFTRISLALFGQVPWRAVPTMPVGIMLLPRWSPFHLSKVSYWSRTVIVPLLILMSEKPKAANPDSVHIRELFEVPPEQERRYIANHTGTLLGFGFVTLDAVLRKAEPLFPSRLRRRAISRAVEFVSDRLNGEHGIGGIFPAMANVVMAFRTLGYPDDHPDFLAARSAIRRLLVIGEEEAWCQPCLSPVWDTALSMMALAEAGVPSEAPVLAKASAWLREEQISEVSGDWSDGRPDLAPGGWAFQYRNDHYPDVDDTAVVAMALHRVDPEDSAVPLRRAADWILGMQSKSGGWGSFDADNTHHYLNHIPFADHGALLDPPSADVSARCLSYLSQSGCDRADPRMRAALSYLLAEQEEDGSWFGRWGTNYVYGTWSALSALNVAGVSADDPVVRKAVAWLESRQRDDGGWGEDGSSYWPEHRDAPAKASTATQTAWALLALMAAGERDSESVRRGIEYLLHAPRRNGKWDERYYNAVGFPRVFYLLYHGYPAYFPLWALARYRRLRESNLPTTSWGI